MNASNQVEISKAIILGEIKTRLELHAQSLCIPTEELTTWVGTILLIGSKERAENTMRTSALSGRSSKMDKRLRKVALGSSTRKSGSRKISKIKQYWANMTAEERSAEMKRRLIKGKRAARKVA